MAEEREEQWVSATPIFASGEYLTQMCNEIDRLRGEVEALRNERSTARDLVEWVLFMDNALRTREAIDDGDAVWCDTVRCALDLKARMGVAKPSMPAPGHTDLMISPEGIDSFGDSFGDPLAMRDRAEAAEARAARTEVTVLAEKPRQTWPSFYATVWPLLQREARKCGYCLALHGSLVRDMDVIAVPWVEGALSAEELVAALCEATGGQLLDHRCPVTKPHGRQAWSIYFESTSYVDLSVIPRQEPAHAD